MKDLSWDDLRELSILASEKADDARIAMPERERWMDTAERLLSSAPTANDLRTTAKLAELDAALQRDPATRQRYLGLAARAIAAAS